MRHALPDPILGKILSIIVPRMEAEGHTDYSLILFGSYAKGTHKPTSDIDIAIKSQRPLGWATWAKIEGDLEDTEIAQTFDIIEYASTSQNFQALIDREGVEIYRCEAGPGDNPAA